MRYSVDLRIMGPFVISILFTFYLTDGVAQGQYIPEENWLTYLNSKTDFSNIDSLDLWNYELETNNNINKRAKEAPIGKIHFWRIRPIDDGFRYNGKVHLWFPEISYDIFYFSDSAYCYDESRTATFASSCLPPNVGGDFFIICDYIFLNRHSCVSCERHDTKVDYCRPIIRKVVEQINKNDILTLDDIVRQFKLTKGVKKQSGG